jgi:hypothetical protein
VPNLSKEEDRDFFFFQLSLHLERRRVWRSNSISIKNGTNTTREICLNLRVVKHGPTLPRGAYAESI